MELCESVALGTIKERDWDCPFAHKKSKGVKNKLSKSSKKLGTALTDGISTKLWADESDEITQKEDQQLKVKWDKDDEVYPLSAGVTIRTRKRVVIEIKPYNPLPASYSGAAHHVIPTNGSLSRAEELLTYIKKGDVVSGNIGYDTNGAENGVWLPTSTLFMRALNGGFLKLPGVELETKYAGLHPDLKQLYAEAVMKKTNRQFHDAHPEYNDEVLTMLGKILSHMKALKKVTNCKKCQEIVENEGKKKPAHGLVDRLNAMSERLTGKLLNGPTTWRAPLFTSKLAANYAAKAQRRGKRR